MKKAITTALLLLFTVTAFSQTKEETLEWLNQNSNYCDIYYKFGSSEIQRSYTFYEDYFVEKYANYGSSTSVADYKVYYKDIFLQEFSKLDESNDIEMNPPITYMKIPLNKAYVKSSDVVQYTLLEWNRFSFRYETDQSNARKNLEKVLRAIMHMAKLHDAEPYKDLFGE